MALRGQKQVPARALFKRAKHGRRYPREVWLADIAILDILGNAIREDVIDRDAGDFETVVLEKLPARFASVGVSDGTTSLRFGASGDQVVQLPEFPVTFGGDDPADLPGPFVIHHDFQRGGVRPARGVGVSAKLFKDSVRMRSVVDDAERVDQVVRLDGDERRELFGVAGAKLDAIRQPEHFGALAGEGHGFIGEVDGGDLRAVAGEIDGVRANAAADLQNFFAAPAFEIRESRDMRLDEIFASFHFIEVFARADGLRGVADVTGTAVPIIADAVDLNLSK